MKFKFLRKIALVGTLIFTLSSIGIYAESPDTESSENVLNNSYFSVQKYGDDKVKNDKESNANITDPETIENLTNLGFTEDEIATFSVSEYERYKTLNGKLVSRSDKYFRVTKDSMEEITEKKAKEEVDEYKAEKEKKRQKEFSFNKLLFNGSFDQTMLQLCSTGGSDTESQSWLKLTTTVSALDAKEFIFKNSFTWLTAPIITLTDVVGLTHASSVSVNQDSEYLKYTYDVYTDTLVPTYLDTDNVYYYTADKKSTGGYAFKYDLLGTDSNGYLVMNNRGFMVYSGTASPSSYVGYSNAYGHYSHQQIAGSIGIGLSAGSMSVTPSTCFDDATDTDVQFYIE